MRLRDYDFKLPPELIAQHPPSERGASRLLCLDLSAATRNDAVFSDLPRLLRRGDLLVMNDTRVIPARLYGAKDTGGRVEIMVERLQPDGSMLAMVRASKAPRKGMRILVDGAGELQIRDRRGEFYVLVPVAGDALAMLERAGHVPLPPYIRRADAALDRDRYQTVYARHAGAVAAPTAGLHFTGELLADLRSREVTVEYLTLHVGAGTFLPLREDRIADNRLHREWYRVSESLCAAIAAARARGGRVIAVGTTTVRALEAAAAGGGLVAGEAETEIFIYPGYAFRQVDALITNFHLPQSSLLLLVCAFAGRETMLDAYRHAVAQGYRFYSYGDAMFITR